MSYLTPEQEKRFHENKHLVYYVLKNKLGTYSISDIDDICAEGYIGLMIACKQYDETRNIAFSTFAIPVIFSKMFSARRRFYKQRQHTCSLEDVIYSSQGASSGSSVLRRDELIELSDKKECDTVALVDDRNTLKRIECLKDRWKTIAILTMQGYNGAEIGRMLGVSRELIRAYLNKIRDFLEADVEDLQNNLRKNSIYSRVPKY